MDGGGFTLEDLRHWIAFGGDWRVVEAAGDRVTLELCTCTGEAMEQVDSVDPGVLAEAVRRAGDDGTS